MLWDTVIGLEVHAQLKTMSKLFSGASTHYGQAANTQTCFIDAGLPGVLPVVNQAAVRMAVQFGLAVNATIPPRSVFERKNYFYPDLPKGYQISQFKHPIVQHGQLRIQWEEDEKIVHIERAHLEEDAGKSLHELFPHDTGIDLNRAGTPLLEIVTTPCLSSASEAVCYLKTLHQLLRFLGICDGNLQEGSFRCDVNISLKPRGATTLGTRTELKNINSFRFIEKAIAYEEARHQDLLESGKTVLQETRLYHPDTNTTRPMRSKENENDYRYFPDPDLLPIEINDAYLADVKASLPPLPEQIKERLDSTHALPREDRDFLLSDPALLNYFDSVVAKTNAPAKQVVNWLKNTVLAALNEQGQDFGQLTISPEVLSALLDELHAQRITAKTAKTLFHELMTGNHAWQTLLEQVQSTSAPTLDLEPMVIALIAQYPQQVAEFRAGKEKLLSFFVGQLMKQTRGQANPEQLHAVLLKHLTPP